MRERLIGRDPLVGERWTGVYAARGEHDRAVVFVHVIGSVANQQPEPHESSRAVS